MASTRRELLKRLSLGAGSGLLSPFLQQVTAQAEGHSSKRPMRFVFVVKSSGIVPEGVTPKSLEGDDARNLSMADIELPQSMSALEPYKNQLSIVQGLSGKMCRGGHSSWFGAMGVYMTGGEHNRGAILRATADAELARISPAPFSHVGLAVRGPALSKSYGGTMYPGITAVAANKELPFQGSPDLAFEQLFGSAVSANGKGQKRFSIQRNLFDFMVDDIKKLEKAVPVTEKDKLDAYLNAFEELQVRHSRLTEMKGSILDGAPQFTDKFTSEVEEVRQEAHFDIATAALISGLTNCVTLRLDNLSTIYKNLGLVKPNHGIGHDESSRTQVECRDLIRQHHTSLLAQMAGKLRAVPEGDGNMLDNTMIIYFSDASNKHHGDCLEWPYVVLGGCSGKLNIAGRYIRFPKYGEQGCRTIGNWWTTLLNAYGNPIAHYGNEDLVLKQNGVSVRGPLDELIV
ncbi:DUF1552 domain-containing protein [bacterium]|nr:DUF1552 domain-containing protein [Rubripirellula sp.]MDB4338664.1 DUF1552 domain-containing protein [Rubripirellula sp.]MDB4810055.1 DUF1552 domain-containing protein [bacterium]MDC0279174.1 DUF1552 domain-containing protein [bacterium]